MSVEYVGPLSEADVEPADVDARAAELFGLWQSAAREAERMARLEALDLADEADVSSREAVEEGRREYLIEFVEVHNRVYSEFDPRNSKPGTADTWIVYDQDNICAGTYPTEAEADLHTLPGWTAEPLPEQARG